ncbi:MULTISPECIES: DUF1350 family protein [Trichocoleus]|uniref:DUF1350 family protein n=1 Tax=Trichocoleus desertorum GB2-A4 TaxID=2933944 RepID=A0ABV0J578_9CYAN|nr:DUF1350 family protein [Trichocoleus sp. FACHB-46]MBD1863636.1 DUF1350 family protein [Trichocoleus sp. FACHB-46]
MDWQEVSGNWVLIPPRPIAIIHFLGGAFVATAPHVTYRWLLEHLSRQGYVIIATPFVNTMDHGAIAHQVLRNFERAFAQLQTRGLLQKRYFPIYGLGHSMGCKLHLLIGSSFAVERAGNILISFNNYAARDAIPLMDQLSPSFAVEFTPSPLETMALVSERYQVRRNLLIKFTNDTLDQTITMSEVLKERFPDMVTLQKLPGSHTTPLGQDVAWKSGSVFTPLDAIAQWMKQEVYRELNQLKQSILLWLDPFMKL